MTDFLLILSGSISVMKMNNITYLMHCTVIWDLPKLELLKKFKSKSLNREFKSKTSNRDTFYAVILKHNYKFSMMNSFKLVVLLLTFVTKTELHFFL